jgi:cell division protein FtsA
MEKTIHVVALDLGTSKIAGMVARKNEEGTLSILASEQILSDKCIRRGYIFNMEETTNKVSLLIARLNRKLDSPIEKIYIGVGGQSIRTEPFSIKKEVPKGVVTQDLLDAITEEAQDFELDSLETLAVVSPEYYLDGQLESNPKGAICSVIDARFNLIVGRSTLKEKLIPAIRRSKQEVAKFLISPLATAEAVLTEKEKELGCALVEFGAGVTYVSVYKGGLLRYLVTIPLGGAVITKDIRSIDILDAEEFKIKHGSALSEPNEENQVNVVIEARADEIIENVVRQIGESGYAQSLGGGIIITGGAAQLKDLPELIRTKTGKEVRLASTNRKLVNQAVDLSQNPENSCIIGMLFMGTEECLKEKEEEVPFVKAGETNLFGEIDNQGERKTRKEKKKTDNIFTKLTRKMEGMSNSLFNEETEE